MTDADAATAAVVSPVGSAFYALARFKLPETLFCLPTDGSPNFLPKHGIFLLYLATKVRHEKNPLTFNKQ